MVSRALSRVAAILAMACCLATVLTSCHSGGSGGVVTPSAVQLLGDMDNDGNPSVNDAIAILRVVVGLAPADMAADANQDGSAGVSDAIAVLRCVVGFDAWPIGSFRPPPTSQLTGVHVVTDFVVDADERIECVGDVTVQCDTATISGELYAQDAVGDGTDGGSITIAAQGDVVVTGILEAGDGAPGDPEHAGGVGGTLAITSADGSITLGGTEVASAQGVPSRAIAGDGGDGGAGLLGGAGGTGGSLVLDCPSGTLTINQQPGLLHIGNGGDGGDGLVAGDDLLTFEVPEQLSNGGGNSGVLSFHCSALTGIALQDTGGLHEGAPLQYGVFDDGAAGGGIGGDAGAFSYGVDPITEGSTWPSLATTAQEALDSRPWVTEVVGTSGGWGQFGGGRGASVRAEAPLAVGAGAEGRMASARGGEGGEVAFLPGVAGPNDSIWAWLAQPESGGARGGDGGHALARGSAGNSGGPGQSGGWGGWANADGGNGGPTYCPTGADPQHYPGGDGGDATAVAGDAGNGGANCYPPGQGGDGGKGGSATAQGGEGGAQFAMVDVSPSISGHGAGGDAVATGGRGGDGGNGNPPGVGDGAVDSIARGGEGEPEGSAQLTQGGSGQGGVQCVLFPHNGYTVATTSGDYTHRIRLSTPLWSGGVTPQQAQTVYLGGPDNPVAQLVGQTIALSPDAGRLWAASVGGVFVYNNPLAGGDRPPDIVLTPSGVEQPGFIADCLWYDTTTDALYCADGADIYAWHGASTMAANAVASRTIHVSSLGAPVFGSITGAGNRDIMFGTAGRRVVVIDAISAVRGTVEPDRIINTEPGATGGLAYDSGRDRLYAACRDQVLSQHRLIVIANASAVEGVTAVTAVGGIGTSHDRWPVAVAAFPQFDEVLVGVLYGDLVAFTGASGLTDQSTPAAQQGLELIAFCAAAVQ